MSRTLKDWVIASRPWSFPASLIPGLAITSYLFCESAIEGWSGNWINAALAIPMLICLQAAGNLIGDYYDHVKGVDLPGSLNGVRHIQSGMFTPKEVLTYGYCVLAVACAMGLVIVARVGLESLWLGVAAVLLVVCYPWLKAHAMGDLDILLGYALLPAVGIGLAVTGEYNWWLMLLSLPFGLLTVAILHANNTRDILNDRRAGLQTMCGAMGGKVSQWVYLVEFVVAYSLVPIYVLTGMITPLAFLTYLTLPLAFKLVRTMLKAEPLAEIPIATLDQQTAQVQLVFGLLFSLSFVIAAFL